MKKNFTAKDLEEYILSHTCTEFEGAEATYYIGVDEYGDLVDYVDGESQFTVTVDCSEWAEDDSPARFYDEFETPENPEFKEVIASFLRQM